MRWRRISLCIFILTIFFLPSTDAKPFEHTENGKNIKIFIGEVSGYGEHELQSQFFDRFKEALGEVLGDFSTKGKITVVDDSWINGDISSEKDFSDIINLDSVRKNIHMDAIAYSPSFQKELANVKMIFYAEKIFGREYFWDDNKLAARKKMIGKPYHISPQLTNAAKTIGQEYGADYLLFCNLMDADIILKNSIFKMTKKLDEKPKQIRVISFFYLIDTKTGLVYEGYNFSDKTSQILNLLGQYGNDIDATKLLLAMFKAHSQRIVEDVYNEGTKVLSKGN
ncbi:MAG: hypothetical protein IK062_06925 [Selenomonadaceae bacterium]|nr:hypothetical protein [Selenomonadaceae bacterium]